MGSLSHFDVKALAERYRCTVFVETGTGTGEGLAHARAAAGGCFDMLCSTEINPVLWRQAKARFDQHADVAILLGPSSEGIKDILHVFGGSGVNILWWLDAHFPGADYGLAGYGDEQRDSVRMPLREELDLIRGRLGGAAGDVVLVDDTRLFYDADFEAGLLPAQYRSLVPDSLKGLGWITADWAATHDIRLDTSDHGYLGMTPKRED